MSPVHRGAKHLLLFSGQYAETYWKLTDEYESTVIAMDYIYIGRVANTHGVRGELKVFPTTDDPARFKKLKKVVLEDTKGNDREYKVLGIKMANKFVLVKLEGVEDMDSALQLKQSIVKIPKKQALPLEKDEFYVQDLIGLEVFEEGDRIGVMKDVLFTGANDVYVIEMLDGRELLLPNIKACVLDVSLRKKRMDVHVMKGLL